MSRRRQSQQIAELYQRTERLADLVEQTIALMRDVIDLRGRVGHVTSADPVNASAERRRYLRLVGSEGTT